MIKIAHCIASMDANSGGTTTAVLDILKEQSKYVDLELYTLNSPAQVKIPIVGVDFFSENVSFLDYSYDLGAKMKGSSADIFHNHALWNLPMHQMAVHARKIGKPYMISVHGMLEPWSLSQGKMKKNVAMYLYQRKDLREATCLHATAEAEARSIRKSGYRNPIAVIPNGIDMTNYPMKEKEMAKFGKKKMLFLSRVHHKKGIEILIEAWSLLEASLKHNWEVEIAGNGEKEYIASLQNKIQLSGLANEIKITGAHFGEDKIKTYHSADVFVLPTYSENFGMVVAEALSCGIPVITTKGTPWKDLEDYNAGSWIEIGVEPLKKTLEVYLQKDNSELERMGRNGRKLVEEKYSIESVGEKFKKLYEWMLNKGEKPEFVL